MTYGAHAVASEASLKYYSSICVYMKIMDEDWTF